MYYRIKREPTGIDNQNIKEKANIWQKNECCKSKL